jgi:hypothetical protein
MYLWPYNGESPNNLKTRNPDVLNIFNEIWDESTFPVGTLSGNAWEALHYTSSGEQSDWILGALGIPSICPEIGSSDFFSYQWNVPFRKVVVNILEENINWLEHTYQKIGNQIEITPIGHRMISDGKALLYLNVSNKGMSDQVAETVEVRVADNRAHVLSGRDKKAFEISGLKKRSYQIEAVPVQTNSLDDIAI